MLHFHSQPVVLLVIQLFPDGSPRRILSMIPSFFLFIQEDITVVGVTVQIVIQIRQIILCLTVNHAIAMFTAVDHIPISNVINVIHGEQLAREFI